MLIGLVRNWQIRALPGTLSRTRLYLQRAIRYVCGHHWKIARIASVLPMHMALVTLERAYESPKRKDDLLTSRVSILVIRIRRALRRAELEDLEKDVIIDGHFVSDMFMRYVGEQKSIIQSRLLTFMDELFLPQVKRKSIRFLFILTCYQRERKVHRRTSF